MLSPNLEQTLHRALALASERRHDYATLEHLLLALTDDQDAVAVMRACNVDIDRLKRDLVDYVDNQLANIISKQQAVAGNGAEADSRNRGATGGWRRWNGPVRFRIRGSEATQAATIGCASRNGWKGRSTVAEARVLDPARSSSC